MNKQKFIRELQFNLSKFERSEVEEIINYYEELIADKMENGLSEEATIRSLGNITDIINEMKMNIVSKRIDTKKSNSTKNFLIILGICSTPILLPLGITFATLYFVMFIVLLALILAFGVSGIATIITVVFQGVSSLSIGGNVAHTSVQIGLGFIIGSILVLLSIYLNKITKYLLNQTNKWFTKIIKRKSIKGEEL
ncbi:DUF1700 domain-containing protein [Acholeplasma hippikon]|nr:DUF1700 domain-containing protein [Acholeplasma hippikon]